MTSSAMGRRAITVASVGVALTCLLAGCGSGGGGGQGGSDAAPGGGANLTGDALVEAANKEGQLNWINTFTDEQIPMVVKAFNAKYPKIKVDAIKLSSEIVPRITTEQRGGKFNVDVVSGSANDVGSLTAAGALAEYDSPHAPEIPGYPLPSGYKNVIYLKSTVIAWNPTALKKAGLKAPTSWEDLTKPEWKGKFNIVANSSGVDFYLGLITAYGHDKALELVKALAANNPVLSTSHTQATTQVQAGEPIVNSTAYNYLAANLKEKDPSSLDYLNTDPMLTTINPINLVAKAPHPNAAKLFIDWLLTDGQKIIVEEMGRASMAEGAGNKPTVWDPTKWKPAFAQPDITVDENNKYIDEYTQALGSQP